MHNRTNLKPEPARIKFIWTVVVGIFSCGGIVGGISACCLAERMGRKGGLLTTSALAIVASLIMAFSKSVSSYEMFIIGRFMTGLSAGLNGCLCPMYLVEIAPLRIRGSIATIYQLGITISISIAQLAGLIYNKTDKELWHFLFGIMIIPNLLQVTLIFHKRTGHISGCPMER